MRLARAGVPIAIGSRDAGRAEEAAERARAIVPGGSFSGHDNAGAVARRGHRDPVRAVPQPVRDARQPQATRSTPGQLLIDATVPLAAAVSGKATRMLGVWQGSAAQQAAEMAPAGVRVVSALHTVSAASLADLDHPLEQDVLLCGDSRADKRDAALLIERIAGLRCVDCGKLEMARITESLTAMLIAVNSRYKAHAGIRLAGLPDVPWE